MCANKNIILTGFMGTGKTVVGRAVAKRRGMSFLDTDQEIESREGASIPEIFSRMEEAHFRMLEKRLCREIAGREGLVIATGGGTVIDPENRRLLNCAGTVICLRCDTAEILKRVGNGKHRPMLGGAAPTQRVNQLLLERGPAYALFPFQLDTTHLTVKQAAERILVTAEAHTPGTEYLTVNLPEGGGYSLALGPGALGLLPQMLKDRGITSKIAVVTDTNMETLYLGTVMAFLQEAGFDPFACIVPAGESSKSLAHLTNLYNCFLDRRLDRSGAVVALGGGVIGDLAGYAAATFMRGVAFVQCPTTLLAMIDSSIGGKTGINLSQGKNLVGAFKQPTVIVADTNTLSTLPDAEIRVGMAELIKHAMIEDAELFGLLENSEEPIRLEPRLIARSVSVKIGVVEQDPLESGSREVLNLGHTVGHALEKCSRYSLSHGDAVSVGMVAAAKISHRMGLCRTDVSDRLEDLLTRNELRVRHSLDPDQVIAAMAADKKAIEGKSRFVLINDVGSVQHGCQVDPLLVKTVLEDLRGMSQ